MSFNHVVVWLDHNEAHLIHFNPEHAESERIKTHGSHPHLHVKAAGGSGHAAENHAYFHEITQALGDTQEILIVGPGLEKQALHKFISAKEAKLAGKIVGVETVDHPSDGQLLAYAKKYFRAADRLR
jgi:stalled ribosome rescue protein Dom34